MRRARSLTPGRRFVAVLGFACSLVACGESEPVREVLRQEPLVKERDGPVVHVMDRGTGVAEPWALVRALDHGEGWPEGAGEQEVLDPELLLERFGVSLTANAHGLRRLPRARGPMLVGVRDQDRYGSLWIVPGMRGTVPLALDPAPRRVLRVRVLGSTGPPAAGVRVALVDRVRMRGSDGPVVPRLRAVATSAGADGIAELYWTTGVERGGEVVSSSVALGVPLGELVEEPVDLEQPPVEPVELRLPVTANLTVNVMGLDGEPAPSGYRVRVTATPGESGESLEWLECTEPVVAGRAEFSQIALETPFEITVRPEDEQPTRLVLERGLAPLRRAGENVIEVFDFAHEAPVLTGRVLTFDTLVPLREAMVRIRVEERDGSMLSPGLLEVFTDHEGRFYYGLDREYERTAGRVLRLQRANEAGQLRRGVSVDLSYRSLLPGTVELGDLELRGVPCRATGRIVDQRGRAVSGAEVALGSMSAGSFLAEPRLTTRSSPEGYYGFFDWIGERGAALMHVSHPDILPVAPVPVAPGERGRQLVMYGGATVHGGVPIPAGLPAQLLQVHLTNRRGELPEGVLEVERQVGLFWDGTFGLSNVAPGEYDVELLCLGLSLGQLGKLSVSLSRTSEVERTLSDAYLSGLRAFELSVLDPEGQPARSPIVYLRRLDVEADRGAAGRPEPFETIAAFPRGEVRFVTDARPFELFVVSSGSSLARVAQADLGSELRLTEPQSVRVRWSDLPVPEGRRALARCEYVEDLPEHILPPLRAEILDSEAHFECLLPGTYRITIPTTDAPPQTIEVLPSEAEQSFDLD